MVAARQHLKAVQSRVAAGLDRRTTGYEPNGPRAMGRRNRFDLRHAAILTDPSGQEELPLPPPLACV